MKRITEHGARITALLILAAGVLVAQDPKKPPADGMLKTRRAFSGDGVFGPGVLQSNGRTYVCPFSIDDADATDLLFVDLGTGAARRGGPKQRWSALTLIAGDKLAGVIGVPPQQHSVILNADGSEKVAPQPLPLGAGQPRVAPAGDKMVAVLYDEKMKLTVLAAEGDPVVVTESVDAESAPLWSPDGKRIAYLRRVGERGEMWTAAPGGAAAKLAGEYGSASAIAWSPDSKRVAFLADGALAVGDHEKAAVVWKGEGAIGPPAWSPSGDGILVREERTEKKTTVTGFTIVAPDGKSVRRFKLEPAPANDYVWAPDGASILYRLGRRTGAMMLWVAEVPK